MEAVLYNLKTPRCDGKKSEYGSKNPAKPVQTAFLTLTDIPIRCYDLWKITGTAKITYTFFILLFSTW
jgi:hypothetical protein